MVFAISDKKRRFANDLRSAAKRRFFDIGRVPFSKPQLFISQRKQVSKNEFRSFFLSEDPAPPYRFDGNRPPDFAKYAIKNF
ncbi:MAG: hypothetical protein MJZ47_05135 [Bacteroidales bacterium]|nr:hypothetical protein [Bacteroidales bacterium]